MSGLPPGGGRSAAHRMVGDQGVARLLHSDASSGSRCRASPSLLVEFTEPATSDVYPKCESCAASSRQGPDHSRERRFRHKTLTVLSSSGRLSEVGPRRARQPGRGRRRQAQLANLVRVANQCGCSVVATGVEAEEQWHLLRKLGFSRPGLPLRPPGAVRSSC